MPRTVPAAVSAPTDTVFEARLHTEIRNIGIPPRPAILDKIDAEMRKAEPDFKHLAEIIGSDVGLAASIVKVANSPFFGFGKQARSVAEALLVLGLKTVIHTIAGHALQNTFPRIPSLERFWDSAAQTARISGWLAQRLRGRLRVRPEEAYTFGLFRDCGIPVLMIPFPEYPKILGQANAEQLLPFTDVEDRLLSINHALVGAELAEDWRLPVEIQWAIRRHHDPAAFAAVLSDRQQQAMQHLVAVAQLAEHLIQEGTGLSRTREWGKHGAACLALLDLGEAELAVLLADCREVLAGED
jgi:HD-like signal output (HDOD) protein